MMGFAKGSTHPASYKVMREFCDDPKGFVEGVMAE
jgi:hypothetical protein